MCCVEGSYFQKAKDCTNEFESCLVIVWAIDIDDVICEGCKRPVEEHLLVYFYRFIAMSSYRWSFEVPNFLWAFFSAPTVPLLQCTSILAKKLSLQKFMFCFISFFFLHKSQPAGPVIKTNKGQCRVKKSKTTSVQEIRSP